ncbi:MAG TPA: Gfo/Idh/MocA family oxidoreductase [Thermoflexales bacterium]|nr:Gfo/Idh/MocA family oxidoreductase [Thermoflexales bacterium]
MSTKSSSLKAGVIGCGAIGTLGHIPGFRAANVEIAAVCDANAERAQKVAAEFSIPRFYTDYNELLAQKDIDMVAIGLPNILHAPVTIAALNTGKHVLCEKPMSVNAANAAWMIETARQNERVLSINHQMRFEPTALAMRDAVREGRLGRVYHTESRMIRSAGIPGFGGWFTNKKAAGAGALFDIGVHMLDLPLFILGFPNVVSVKGFLNGELGQQKIGLGGWGADRGTQGVFDVDDTAMAMLTLEDGASLIVKVTWAAFTRGYEERVTLYGTQGGADRSVEIYGKDDPLRFFHAEEGKIVETTPDLSSYPKGGWDASVVAFVDAVKGEGELVVKPEQSLQVMRILDAIAQSAQTGREVVL